LNAKPIGVCTRSAVGYALSRIVADNRWPHSVDVSCQQRTAGNAARGAQARRQIQRDDIARWAAAVKASGFVPWP